MESMMYPSSAAPTILIVDDTAVHVMMLQSVLDAEGFRTITAADGRFGSRT
jgi:CheY-like chemotaxis protein